MSGLSNYQHIAPVFICGHGNSGTTLLLALLDSHLSRNTSSMPVPPEEFIVYWRTSVQAWEHFADSNKNGLLIRYDDLVQQPRVVMQHVCDFLQIGWEDILLKPSRHGVDWSGNSMYGIAFTGISTETLHKYRASLISVNR